MRRFLPMLFILIAALACRLGPAVQFAPPTLTPGPTLTVTEPPPTLTPTASPSPWPTSTPTQALTPTPLPLDFTIQYHPDGPLYVGDLISLSVIAPPGVDLNGASLQLHIDQPQTIVLEPAAFGPWGIAGRSQATIVWGWDTHGLTAGDYVLDFSVSPQGYAFTETVTLLPTDSIPAAQTGAEWASTVTECCLVHYITGTAAERDLLALTAIIDQQAERAATVMGIDFSEPITITLMPRVLGHGGFATDEIYVSYLDRNYSANSWEMVVHHELIHILDRRLEGDLRPSILVEGLAVYQTGGHYQPEEILPRAAALLDGYLGRYIPLAALADDFYNAQHEIGYLEAGALVQYLVETYGWEAYSLFYRDIHPIESSGQSAALDAALQAHFGLTLAQTEDAFITHLRQQTGVEAWQEDVRLTVAYFDTLRRYQQLLDPSAYFRTAWLMDGPAMRQRDIVGDLLRHPSEPANLAIEAMLITASDQWISRDAPGADLVLGSINQVLAAMEQGQPDPFNLHPLSADYLAISSTLFHNGYEVQSIELSGDTAVALVTAQDMTLLEVRLTRLSGSWQLN